MRRYTTALATLVLLAACAGDDDPATDGPESVTIRTTTTVAAPSTDGPATTTSGPTTVPSAPTDAPAASSNPTNPTPATITVTTAAPTTVPRTPVVGEPVVAVETVGSFDRPIDLVVRPGDGALWIVEQGGRLLRVDGDDRTVALDLSGRISSGGEQGLLGVAFSPDAGRAYVNRTDPSGTTVISEYAVAPDGTFDTGSERTVLEVAQPFSNHNAGDLEFGPDGLLYVPLGDGGSAGDPRRNGHDPTTLLGSLLRIDPTPAADAAYTVPADNPFAAGPLDGVAGAPEVWAWGLRNPWKIFFDGVTGDLWIPDVGQNQFEEINVVSPVAGRPAGFAADFGWSAFEGDARFNTDVDDTGRTTAPVLTYDHGDGCSISGGAVYRGRAIPELEPAFVYSDYCTGTIWALDLAAGRNLTLVSGLTAVTAVRTGPDGELYVVERSGRVLRLVPG